MRVEGEPGADAAVTLVAPPTLHPATEDQPQSDCQPEALSFLRLSLGYGKE